MPYGGIRIEESELPIRSELLGWSQFVEFTGLHPSRIGELIEMGWLDPVVSGERYLFRKRDVYRLRKFQRLCQDFGLSATGGSIIVDLLERVEALEREVRQLRRLL
ncbi:MAG: chaperone modulator CbpM [Thermodesulfobacteriota bacterium]